jgi:hypothetical protein
MAGSSWRQRFRLRFLGIAEWRVEPLCASGVNRLLLVYEGYRRWTDLHLSSTTEQSSLSRLAPA